MCLQETLLYDDDDTSPFEIEGYKLVPQGKSCSDMGGLITYIDNNFEYEIYKSLKYDIFRMS